MVLQQTHDKSEKVISNVQVKSLYKFTDDMDKLVAKFDKNIQFLESIIITCTPPDEDLKVFYDRLLALDVMLKSTLVDVKIDNAKTIEAFRDKE